MERQRFEDSWKESFKDAEVNPPDSLWTNIELDLEKENGSKMKRRIMFFQLLAAASIAFAMTFAGVGVYFMMNNNATQFQLATDLPPAASTTSEPPATPSAADGHQAATAADQTTAGTPSSAASVNSAFQAQPSAAAATTAQDQAAAYGPGRPVSPADAAAAASRRATTGSNPTASAADRQTQVPDQSTIPSSNRVASTAAHTAPATDRASGLVAAADQNNLASDQAPASSRIDSRSRRTRSASDRVTSASTTPASDRVAAASGRTTPASDRAVSASTTPAVDDRVASTSGRTTSASDGIAPASTTITSDRGATPSGRTTPASDRVASASTTSAVDDRVASTSGRTTSVSDGLAPASTTAASHRVASASGQTTSASGHDMTEPTARQVVPANPFDAVALTSPEERRLSTTRGSLPLIAHPAEPSLATAAPTSQADPVALMLARLADEEKQYAEAKDEKKNKKDKGTERLWTSVGVAAGAFNMINSTSSASAAASTFNSSLAMTSNSSLTTSTVKEQASASGSAYSVGLNLGGKIASRWVVQGGVNYLTQSSGYTSNAVLNDADGFKLPTIGELDKASASGRQESRVVQTAAYRINTSQKYLSVPLQAGYLVVNRTFGLQLNAGVSTDLFVQTTVAPDGGTFEKSTQTGSDGTPYRPINFSGLLGSEFSYRIGTHYRIALNPGLRYPFNSIYKSDVAVNAVPLTFDVGLKFRYIFH